MNIPKCKGATDVLPQDMRRFRRVKNVFRNHCEKWGYGEVRTPTLEYLHLFTSAGTLSPNMLGRVYSFLDWDGWSGERVVLRPDGTIPAVRLYVQNMPGSPFARLYYIENMFSFEGTGQQSRERWQCGVELLGSTAPEGDAELIMLSLEILGEMELAPIHVKLSHVGLIKVLLKELGLEKEAREQRLSEILTGDVDALNRIEEQPADVKRFLKLLLDLQGTSEGFLHNISSILPPKLAALKPCIDDLAQITELLDSIGQEYEIDFASGEGFDYYTGTVFQFYGSGELLGTGGRYDELVPLVGGDDVPASGFALFIDRIMKLLPEISPPSSRIMVRNSSANIKGMKVLFEIARLLRENGHIVEFDACTDRKRDCRWIVSPGDDGVSLTLIDTRKDQTTGHLSLDQLLEKVGQASWD